LAGWKKISSKGTTFLSLSISEFKEKEEGGYPRAQSKQDSFDGDEPF